MSAHVHPFRHHPQRLALDESGLERLEVVAPDGGYRLTPYDPVFERKMAKAEEIIGRYRNMLHVLAQ